MGGIKGTVFVLAILGAAVAVYLRSSLSNEEGTALKAETVVEKTPEPSPDASQQPVGSEMQNTTMTPKVTEVPSGTTPAVSKQPKQGPGPSGPDAAALKKIHDFHAKERHLARQVLKRCKAGQEKRPLVCSHARQVMKAAPRREKSTGK